MKLVLSLLFCCLISGCATGCYRDCIAGFGPGNSLFNRASDQANRDDPCQRREFSSLTGTRLKPQGYDIKDMPEWCFAGQLRVRPSYVYDRTGRQLYTIR